MWTRKCWILPASRWSHALVVLLGGAVACGEMPTPAEPIALSLSRMPSERPDSVYNRWIVLFREDVANPAAVAENLLRTHGGHAIHFYTRAVKGFAVANLPGAAVAALRANPIVRLVEESIEVPHTAVQSLPLDSYSYQTSSLWALDRMHVRPLAFDGQFTYDYTGSGVHIYVLDTGIRCTHQEFAGRIGESVTRLSWSWGADPCIDQDGHGTGVASAAAGSTYGVAKTATLHSVRINDNGDAHCDDIVAGFDWVVGNAIRPAVANLSYGGVPNCLSVMEAIENTVQAGIHVTKSAGNAPYDGWDDRANQAWGAIIVGASDYSDQRATFSSGLATYGSVLTLFAPGYRVRVAFNDGDSQSGLQSGSSFSAPYVAGVLATYLQQDPNAPPSTAFQVIRRSGTTGVLSNIGSGSPNVLLNSMLRSLRITGPSYISTDADATYTWTGDATGGTGSSYYWDISVNGGPFTFVSSASFYSRTIYAGESYDFTLRVTATVSGESHTATHDVTVRPPEGPPSCPPPELTC